MRTCLCSLTIHLLLTEVLRPEPGCVMSFLWDSVYSVFERTRNYLVDPPGEENPENPELATTGERLGATNDLNF